VLALTPALIRSAKAVVSICKRIDWDTLKSKATQCDIVHLHFQSIETVLDANHTLLEMAAGDCDLRRAIVSRIERAFRLICPPVAPSEAAGKVYVPLSNSEVEKLLNDLVAPKDAANFADLCVRAWVLYKEIYREASEIRRREAHLYDPLPPLPQDDIPPWLGPAAKLWIGVPIGLAVAEPIVFLCQRIAEINTGETSPHFEPGEEDSLRLHHRLWTECKPRSYRVPVDDFSHPICHQLQTFLDAFIPKVRKFVCAVIDQGKVPKLSAVAESAAITSAAVGAQPRTDEQKQQGVGENTAVSKQTVASELSKTGGMQSELENDIDPVLIRIGKEYTAVVPSRPKLKPSTGRRCALLALVVLADENATEFHVKNTPDFVKLTHGRISNVSRDWDRNRVFLKSAGIKVRGDDQNESHLSGFRLEIHAEIDKDKIRKRLSELVLKRRLKP